MASKYVLPKALMVKIIDIYNGSAEVYMPMARNSSGVGILPNGQAYFKLCLKSGTITKKSLDELYNVGLNKVKGIRAEIDSKEKY